MYTLYEPKPHETSFEILPKPQAFLLLCIKYGHRVTFYPNSGLKEKRESSS